MMTRALRLAALLLLAATAAPRRRIHARRAASRGSSLHGLHRRIRKTRMSGLSTEREKKAALSSPPPAPFRVTRRPPSADGRGSGDRDERRNVPPRPASRGPLRREWPRAFETGAVGRPRATSGCCPMACSVLPTGGPRLQKPPFPRRKPGPISLPTSARPLLVDGRGLPR